jgi:hypothetical protein
LAESAKINPGYEELVVVTSMGVFRRLHQDGIL